MAGRRAGTTERTFQSMNRKVEEMTKRWCGGWNGGKASSTDAMTTTTVRFRASRSGSTNYELKIDEPLSVSSRAQPDKTGKGWERERILDESLLSDTESRRRDFSAIILTISDTERLF